MASDTAPADTINARLVKAMGSPIRIQILEHLKYRNASPVELEDELGLSVNNLSYHFRVLRELDCIRPAERIPVKGGRVQKVRYESVIEMILSTSVWAALAPTTKAIITQAGLKSALDKAHEATVAKTIDARPDRHLSVVTLMIDERSWSEFSESLDALLDRFYLASEESEARSGDRDERFPATFTAFLYESPELGAGG